MAEHKEKKRVGQPPLDALFTFTVLSEAPLACNVGSNRHSLLSLTAMPFEKGPGTPKKEQPPSKVEVIGDMSFDEADYMNVPIQLHLMKDEDDEGKETDYYTLMADNYQPRRRLINEGSFLVRSKDPEALRKIVRDKVIPIFQAALTNLESIADGKSDMFYYWDEEKPKQQPLKK